MKVTTAAAVLHNIALAWKDDLPVDDHPALLPVPDLPVVAPPQPELDYDQVPNFVQRRQRAQEQRDNYR